MPRSFSQLSQPYLQRRPGPLCILGAGGCRPADLVSILHHLEYSGVSQAASNLPQGRTVFGRLIAVSTSVQQGFACCRVPVVDCPQQEPVEILVGDGPGVTNLIEHFADLGVSFRAGSYKRGPLLAVRRRGVSRICHEDRTQHGLVGHRTHEERCEAVLVDSLHVGARLQGRCNSADAHLPLVWVPYHVDHQGHQDRPPRLVLGVDVRAAPHEPQGELEIVGGQGVEDRSAPLVVGGVRAGAGVQQAVARGRVPVADGLQQSGVAVFVAQVKLLGSIDRAQQPLNGSHLPRCSDQMQSGVTLAVLGVDVCTEPHELLGHCDETVTECPHERGVAVLVRAPRLRLAVEECLHQLEVAARSREEERGLTEVILLVDAVRALPQQLGNLCSVAALQAVDEKQRPLLAGDVSGLAARLVPARLGTLLLLRLINEGGLVVKPRGYSDLDGAVLLVGCEHFLLLSCQRS
mmetsp:Transcript_32331/g.93127  ORF Transcript_32331/g.93127 Transcript_32331/m.93127 type:complete len:463 (+) Transcript_32331:1102-2490(+)